MSSHALQDPGPASTPQPRDQSHDRKNSDVVTVGRILQAVPASPLHSGLDLVPNNLRGSAVSQTIA